MPRRVVPKAGRLVRVSLRDVPLGTRQRAATYLVKALARDGGWRALEEARLIQRAVLMPSERRYLLPEACVVGLLGAVPDGQPRRYRRVEIGGVNFEVPDGWAEG